MFCMIWDMHSYRFEFHGVTPCLQKETYHIYLHFITHYTIAYAMNLIQLNSYVLMHLIANKFLSLLKYCKIWSYSVHIFLHIYHPQLFYKRIVCFLWFTCGLLVLYKMSPAYHVIFLLFLKEYLVPLQYQHFMQKFCAC